MNAIDPAIATPVAAPAVASPNRRPGFLGALALLLWAGAVCLGIVAPLAGLQIDTGIVVGVLVASGVTSLLSLPAAAGFLGRGDARSPRVRDPDRRD